MTASPSPFQSPESRLPVYQGNAADDEFFSLLTERLRQPQADPANVDGAFAATSLPKRVFRLILILYAPGEKRILVSRSDERGALRFSAAFAALLGHPRRDVLAAKPFRLQVDIVTEAPVAAALAKESRYEPGVDGLLMRGPDAKLHVFAPGDAYVRSIMSVDQLRHYLEKAHGASYVAGAVFERFRSLSFLAGASGWCQLYRGHPLVGKLSREKLEHAVELAIGHIRRTQEPDGKFLYYYDAATDSRRDHEHPKRDPVKNPYYNILRHCGGGLTCVFQAKLAGDGLALDNARRALDYLLTTVRIAEYGGREGAFIYSEKKSKLGGAGLALYFIVEYQQASGDERYRVWADRLAWHLLNQITASGEFIYYNIYLDQPVTEADNQQHFSFYYPGEAICGLAAYLRLIGEDERAAYFEALHRALDFLLVVRPRTRANEYTAVPSDGWLMMGIKELWDFEPMRRAAYVDFVFADAQKMIDHMYKVDDAPYPDYAGAFYYAFGDYPYADGARCEGLLGAYELALRMGDTERAVGLWPALKLAAWALLHLVNTGESIYFAPNPEIALGGIRFKFTRQWFRIDTIQHVASFYAKLLPYWERAEREDLTANR